MKLSVKRYFNNATETYDSSASIQQIIAAEVAKKINEKYFKIVLEIGSGTGLLTKLLMNEIEYESYVNIDIAFELLKVFKQQSEKMFFINTDADFLPLKQNTFDLLVSSSTFQWLEYPESSFKNFINILKNNGKFYFSIFGKGTFFEMDEISKITGFGSVKPMLSADCYEKILNELDVDFKISTKTYVLFYNSVIDFLKIHKKTGARYTSKNKPSGKKAFNAFCQLYSDIFGTDKGIPVTYSIHYIEGNK